jgi:hypothetical protein
MGRTTLARKSGVLMEDLDTLALTSTSVGLEDSLSDDLRCRSRSLSVGSRAVAALMDTMLLGVKAEDSATSSSSSQQQRRESSSATGTPATGFMSSVHRDSECANTVSTLSLEDEEEYQRAEEECFRRAQSTGMHARPICSC